MHRRILSLLVAGLMLVMLLGAAGHALHHLQQRELCADCPVCLQLSAWRGLLSRMAPFLWMLMPLLAAAGCRLLPLFVPFCRAWTPVALKVKLTN